MLDAAVFRSRRMGKILMLDQDRVRRRRACAQALSVSGPVPNPRPGWAGEPRGTDSGWWLVWQDRGLEEERRPSPVTGSLELL
ncbi:hypothetical protein GCM10017687_67950 [Streptomyces echinatus]